MKIAILFLSILILSSGLAAADVEFRAPDLDFPHYRIIVPFEVKTEQPRITEISINGRKWPVFFAFKEGKNADLTRPLDPGKYEIHLDYAW